MTYEESVHYLNTLINYEKTPTFSYGNAFKLNRVIKLAEATGNPQNSFSSVHITGTKGKGSVAAFTDALLRNHGHRTGLYTSPHLVSFRERIRVSGRMINEELFAEIMTSMKLWIDAWRNTHPDSPLSFFDVLTTIGFETFHRENVEWGVIEVGMGGRLDATNILKPEVSVITPVALEHMKFLGTTLKEIADEKAGIIKSGTPVVIARQQPDAQNVITARCSEFSAPLIIVDVKEDDDSWRFHAGGVEYRNLPLATYGRHQRTNFALAVTTLTAAGISLDRQTVSQTAQETVLPGRLQEIGSNLFVDVAHTPESAHLLAETLSERFSGRNIALIFSAALDKNVTALARILGPYARRVVLPHMPGLRSMAPEEMLDVWRESCPDVEVAESTSEALALARHSVGKDGLVCVCGSFIVVGAVMELLGIQP